MILAIAAALALAPPESGPLAATPVASLDEAARAIAAGRLDQARDMLAAAVAAGASGEPVDRLLADLAFARHDDERAYGFYHSLIQAHPADALLLERGGIVALRLGRDAQATEWLDRATALPDAGWRAWNARGVAADRRQQYNEAEAAYAQAQRRAPGEASIANNRGWSALLRGDWAAARARFAEALALDPALARARHNLELAEAALAADLPQRRPRESDDDWAARLNDAGVAAAARGERDRAAAAFAQAIELRHRWYDRAAANLKALGQTP